MTIAIIDFKAGNLTSVRLAFESFGATVKITREPAQIRAAERVVFPGVGAAGAAMAGLRELGLLDLIPETVYRGTPFLGICVGAQLLFEWSAEDNGTTCLGLLRGAVRRFRPTDRYDKVPHMGWNGVRQVRPHPIFAGIPEGGEFYFVHGYFPAPADEEVVLGRTDYAGESFASVLGRGNLWATQFHPEKSGRLGLKMLENFAGSGRC